MASRENLGIKGNEVTKNCAKQDFHLLAILVPKSIWDGWPPLKIFCYITVYYMLVHSRLPLFPLPMLMLSS